LGYAVEAQTAVWLQDSNVPLPTASGKQGRPRRNPRLEDWPPVHSLLAVATELPASA